MTLDQDTIAAGIYQVLKTSDIAHRSGRSARAERPGG
jgi:hypothetical protein